MYRFLFRDRRLVILSIGLALSTFSIFIPPYFIPIFAKAIHGFSDSALVGLAVWNLASTIGRVFGGFAADHLLGPINCLLVSTFLTGISALLIWPFASNLAVLLVFIIINGIGCGSFFSLVPPVLGRIFGVETIVELLPMVWTTWFFGFFFVRPPYIPAQTSTNVLSGNPYRIFLILSIKWQRCCTISSCRIFCWCYVSPGIDFHAWCPLYG